MSVEPFERACPRARQDGLVVEQVDEELLIYDLERDRAHSLNATAARVFRHCDGERDAAALAARLSDEAGESVDEELVRAALGRLSDARLLEEPVARTSPQERGWSRREALRKLGYAGAAGLALPVVKSIVAPTPAEAQVSACLGAGAVCGTALNECTGPVPCCPGFTCQLPPVSANCVCLGPP